MPLIEGPQSIPRLEAVYRPRNSERRTCGEQSCLCLELATRAIYQLEKRICLLPGQEYKLAGLMAKQGIEGGNDNDGLPDLAEIRLECNWH